MRRFFAAFAPKVTPVTPSDEVGVTETSLIYSRGNTGNTGNTEKNTVGEVSPVSDNFEHDPDEVAARMNEPRLPPIGTPERTKLDNEHKAMCAGLMQAARWPRPSPTKL
jgi:hypothetical protein